MRDIRTFSILENESTTKRIKISLIPYDGHAGKGYVWCNDDQTIADEGTIYKTVREACSAAKSMYRSPAWDMRASWFK
jgi:hypothetical protein